MCLQERAFVPLPTPASCTDTCWTHACWYSKCAWAVASVDREASQWNPSGTRMGDPKCCQLRTSRYVLQKPNVAAGEKQLEKQQITTQLHSFCRLPRKNGFLLWILACQQAFRECYNLGQNLPGMNRWRAHRFSGTASRSCNDKEICVLETSSSAKSLWCLVHWEHCVFLW